LKEKNINGAFRKISLVNGEWQTDFGGNERRMLAMTPEMKVQLKVRFV
jgi:hypothetical protein